MTGSERETCVSTPSARALRVRHLNDTLRTTGQGGEVVITAGVQALMPQQLAALITAVRHFDRFDTANDPHCEHDMGAVTLPTGRYFWKIDYYDRDLLFGSPDPADPDVTCRMLTIMRSDEY
jgi:hypothetical protein